jgi:hypothetical protein
VSVSATDLVAERDRIDGQLRALDDATGGFEWETAEQAAQRHDLNARWLEVDRQIEAGARNEAKASERATEAAPDQPADFDAWRTEVGAWRDRLLGMRAAAETLAEQAKALPEHSARREVAERRAEEALVAAQHEAEALAAWKNHHELRLSSEKMADDAALAEATRRWVRGAQALQHNR